MTLTTTLYWKSNPDGHEYFLSAGGVYLATVFQDRDCQWKWKGIGRPKPVGLNSTMKHKANKALKHHSDYLIRHVEEFYRKRLSQECKSPRSTVSK